MISFKPCGDCAVLAVFGNEIDKNINTRIKSCLNLLEETKHQAIVEIVPSYCSIEIIYRPEIADFNQIVGLIKTCLVENTEQNDDDIVKVVEIPTVYGGKFGEDLEFVANHNGLSIDEVIKIHTSRDYLVYMLGFTPGFAYLGGMDEKIATPRLKTPRQKIQAGSVGIAGNQTGMYPSQTPGGWQIIGQTPLKLYDDTKEEPCLINTGDYVRYVSISEDDFNKIKSNLDDFKVKILNLPKGKLRE